MPPKRGRSTRGRPAKKAKTKEETEVRKDKLPNAIDFSLGEPDPVVEHLKEYSKKDSSFRELSLETILLDQIALEGLSGITLRRLFNIVEALFPNLPCTKDLNCQKYIWSIVLRNLLQDPFCNATIKAFHLDPTRNPQLDCDNPKGVVIDKVIELPLQTVKRIAKSDSLLSPVQDGLVMGSCANYLSRIDVTPMLVEKCSGGKMNPLECMYLLEEQYGLDNVYLTANQTLRTKAILPDWADPNVDIKLREYCALELIGRARSLGTVFPNDKTLGRYRIMLEAKGFITQFQASMSSPIEHHLKRFASHQPTEQTADNAKSNKSQAHAKVKQSHKSSSSRKKTDNSRGKEEEEEEEEEDEDERSGRTGYRGRYAYSDSEDEDEERDSESLTLSMLCFNPSKLKPNRDILSTVYDLIADSGGISQLDLRRELHLPRFHLRNHLKNLISLEMVCTRPPKDGDNGFKTYFAPKASKRKKIKEELLLAAANANASSATGIMASWDEADLRAKKIIGHKRSSFSQAEDSILILCRIASVLIEPRLKLSWCVNKRLIRDLLHRELVEAHDKTSDACLRRIKYLKRLPNNIMSINELTAELQDDAEIKRLLRSKKLARRVNKRFLRLFKCVRSKIPNLLGIPTAPTTSGSHSNGASTGPLQLRQALGAKTKTHAPSQPSQSLNGSAGAAATNNAIEFGAGTGGGAASMNWAPPPPATQEINDHEELRQKYELIDCQSVASMPRAPTYEAPKNVVDVKLNQASLVTMAFAMASCFGQPTRAGGRQRRAAHWLLDKFYSNYHDRLISSMLSKLNKRSLLTRKSTDPLASAASGCAPSPALSYSAKTGGRLSLKLNQSVLFLLNRYQSHSLIQLANPISRSYPVDLCESNEMASIAMLTSLCAAGAGGFNLDMELRIPANVVGIDQGNENFRTLCDKVNPSTRQILARFMSRCAATGCGGAEGAPEVGVQCSAIKKDLVGDLNSSAASTDNDSTARPSANGNSNKMDDSRRALFLLRHELKTHALDKCGSLADCLIVQPCNIKFYSNQRVEMPAGALDSFLKRSAPVELPAAAAEEALQPPPPPEVERSKDEPTTQEPTEERQEEEEEEVGVEDVADKWLVKSFSLSSRAPPPRPIEAASVGGASEVEPEAVAPTTDEAATDTGPSVDKQGASIVGARIDASPFDKAAGSAAAAAAAEEEEEEETEAEADAEEAEANLITERRSFEARKRAVEFGARAWKQIDGTVHLATLFKLIESILSWLIVLPGVELAALEREFCHLVPEEHLHELLGLMEELELISSERLRARARRPRLFGYWRAQEGADAGEGADEEPGARGGRGNRQHDDDDEETVYESRAQAYVKYCQLLSYCQQPAAQQPPSSTTRAAADGADEARKEQF